MGRGWIYQDNDPKQHQCVTEHKMKLLHGHPSALPKLNPTENELGELKKKKKEAPTWICESAGSGEILYGGKVSELLSHVLQTHQAL